LVVETVYLILKGDGYATLQKDAGPDRRVDWTEGDLFLVEANEITTTVPVRELSSCRLRLPATFVTWDWIPG